MKLLFICSQNQLRSPTAEVTFAGYQGIETDSAGTDRTATVSIQAEQIAWADLIFVMEPHHQQKLHEKFGSDLKNKPIICLDIPDEYEYMNPELIALLKSKILPILKLRP